MGLLGIRERVEMVGGVCSVESAPGKGTTVQAQIPFDPGTKKDLSPMKSPTRITVLLADDHVIVREGLRKLLESESDIEVIGEAATGRQAVVLTGKLHPDVVVMDIAMPNLRLD